MPIVFFISGLSAALLLERSGAGVYFQNRLHKLFLPSLLSAVFILPLVAAAYGLSPENFWRILPAHYWFLIYLLPMYLIPPLTARWTFNVRLRRLIPTLALITFSLIYPMGDWMTLDHAIFDILPKPFLLLYYTVFFIFGCMVSREISMLEKFKNNCGLYFVCMLAAAAVLIYSVGHYGRVILLDKRGSLALLFMFSNNLLSWFSLLFWTALFMKISPSVHRYLKPVNGSALWVYLAHYPLVLLIQIKLEDKDLNVYLKFLMTLGGSLIVCVSIWWTYARLKRAIIAARA
jgi:glucans biosynthesis protein C